MSDQYVVIDLDDVEDIRREGEDIVAVTLSVADGPFDDPHDAGFRARDHWSYEFVGLTMGRYD